MKYIIIILCCIIIFNCSSSEDKTIILWTDRAEFAAYIEEFNSIQNRYIIEPVYIQKPLLLNNTETPDILISENINNSEFFNEFEVLNSIMNKNRINPETFYEQLLNLGKYNNNQVLLPVNFSMPAIMYKSDSISGEFSNMFITFDELKNESINYNSIRSNIYSKMGFFPLWEPEFIYYSAGLFNTDFKANEEGNLIWNEYALDETILFLRNWNEDNDYENELSFTSKYLKIPPYQLIESGRILFYFIDIDNYLEIPKEKRENMDFRWLVHNNQAPVLDNILFTGIPKHAENKNGARAFLEWFFQRETQIKLMEINHLKRLQGVFGIANGFSSLIEINEKDIHKPEYYPIFVGHIPQEDQLLFPKILPPDWINEKKEFVIEYLKESLINDEYNVTLSDLFR
jgi:ABC-type glycerol-3-phosphate transport system substrate-binding protein